MLTIMICDDEPEELTSLVTLFRQTDLPLDYKLHTYDGESALLTAFDSGLKPDLLFLDIQLAENDGIQLAEKIRQRFGSEPLLVFVSSYPDYVFSVFKVTPFDFLRKPLTLEALRSLARRLTETLTARENRILAIKDRHTKEIHYLPSQAIYYFEMQNSAQRLLQITTSKGTIETYQRLKDFAQQLPQTDFCQIYRSIYVQLRYVRGLTKDTVLLKDDIRLPVGKKYAQQLRQRLRDNG